MLTVFTGLPPTAAGHTMYVNLTDYVPHLRRGATMFFGWGEALPVGGMLGADWLETLKIVDPEGEVRPLDKPTEFLTRVELAKEGTHILAAELRPGFYTIYKEGDQKKHHMGPKTEVQNVESSHYYCQQGKAIFNAGALSDTFKRPVGHSLEIIPLKNPALLREGDMLPVQVLFEGKSVPGYPKLMATYMGFSTTGAFAYAKSVIHGRAEVKISHAGVWYLNVNYRTRPTGDLADKCDEVSYTATISFEVGRSPGSDE
ncbi:MAG: DUF4198 domain-containing protein [Planctomycetaceae bacterium]|nr:DUF4198 domain-containing protein [Planctomycetaceae bacterium]